MLVGSGYSNAVSWLALSIMITHHYPIKMDDWIHDIQFDLASSSSMFGWTGFSKWPFRNMGHVNVFPQLSSNLLEYGSCKCISPDTHFESSLYFASNVWMCMSWHRPTLFLLHSASIASRFYLDILRKRCIYHIKICPKYFCIIAPLQPPHFLAEKK